MKYKLQSLGLIIDMNYFQEINSIIEDFYDLKTYIFVLNNGFKIDLPTDLSINDLKNFLNSR